MSNVKKHIVEVIKACETVFVSNINKNVSLEPIEKSYGDGISLQKGVWII
jgi:hypothetical protein